MCAEVEPSSPKSSDSQGSRRGVMFRNRESVRGPQFLLDFFFVKNRFAVCRKDVFFFFVLGNLHLIYLYLFQFKCLTFKG